MTVRLWKLHLSEGEENHWIEVENRHKYNGLRITETKYSLIVWKCYNKIVTIVLNLPHPHLQNYTALLTWRRAKCTVTPNHTTEGDEEREASRKPDACTKVLRRLGSSAVGQSEKSALSEGCVFKIPSLVEKCKKNTPLLLEIFKIWTEFCCGNKQTIY